MDTMNARELISALADGQLQGEDFAHGMKAATADAAALETWRTYHLIGDVLRSSELAAGTPAERFMSRLQASLQSEAQPPTVPAVVPIAPAGFDAGRAAANQPAWRWKLAAGVASVAAVAAIGWNLLGQPGGQASEPRLAAASAPADSSSAVQTVDDAEGPVVVIRDARLDALLAAHRQLGGETALQKPAGFLRNATFEAPAR